MEDTEGMDLGKELALPDCAIIGVYRARKEWILRLAWGPRSEVLQLPIRAY